MNDFLIDKLVIFLDFNIGEMLDDLGKEEQTEDVAQRRSYVICEQSTTAALLTCGRHMTKEQCQDVILVEFENAGFDGKDTCIWNYIEAGFNNDQPPTLRLVH
jgi:hypothetical protein